MIVNGERLEGQPNGALWWPAARLLVVSDLHFEKGTALARRGHGPLPPFDTRETLARIEALVAALGPTTLIALGDSFHDEQGPATLDGEERARIRALTAVTDWVWITGNHDPEPPRDLGGRAAPEVHFGGLHFRHEPRADAEAGEVAGHLHPKAAVSVRGRRVTRACFATDGRRLVMPAFGAYTGGLNVLDRAFAGLFPGPFHAWMLGDRLRAVASTRLSG
ncbi:ligase-associated DNA damage response endonuclease PdeM [Oceanibacterium hippocampi]|uniref:Calcineurin-like phosphoesterase domain-containing protein n=1 Tax=Oceanibacterium hippocampi TaxID=745714 RepID=A0A1Y5SJX6_9PROT|nr:ligase-associated DNA damage response endonuclease PdeM [Oceanibacterium hippocampi]SLN39577.1 hypothetical protein OCH7691_01652 [Oceanibacterium hippocampi]